MAKRMGTTETVNREVADACDLAWTFQSDLAFVTETTTLLCDAVGAWAQVKNLKTLIEDQKVRTYYLEALAQEIREGREWGDAERFPSLARCKDLMRGARERLWREKGGPVSPTILDQLGDE